MGLAYVAAVLEKNGHTVSIIDAPTEGWRNLEDAGGNTYRVGLSDQQIGERLAQWKPDVVGIEIPFSGWSRTAFAAAAIAKSISKDVVTYLDGQHPSAMPKECLANPNTDFVVVGERENTVLELVNGLEKGLSDFSKVKGLGFVKNGKPVLTAQRSMIEDLDSLPFPARHLLPMDIYTEAVRENPLRNEVYKPMTIMITSRGCPFNCVFCSNCTVWGKRWRGRSPENVVAEIEHVMKDYGIKQIDFYDDNMTLDKKRMEGICDLIVKRNVRVEWFTPNGIRADTLDEALLRKMKRAGCKKIRLAPESGVQRVVDEVIGKSLDLKSVEQAVILSKKVGIGVGLFFVIGLIGETKTDIEETIRFAYKLRRLGADSFIFSIATPIYGTQLYEKAKQGGFLKEGFCDEALAGVEPLIETPEFTAMELQELCMRANMVNPTFTRDKLLRAIKNPKRTVKTLLKKK
jgi:anaerobic magnesium-protoporphyrin IX monomethyl ester cyclase